MHGKKIFRFGASEEMDFFLRVYSRTKYAFIWMSWGSLTDVLNFRKLAKYHYIQPHMSDYFHCIPMAIGTFLANKTALSLHNVFSHLWWWARNEFSASGRLLIYLTFDLLTCTETVWNEPLNISFTSNASSFEILGKMTKAKRHIARWGACVCERSKAVVQQNKRLKL